MDEFNKRLTEVDEILSYLPDEDLLKIPNEIRTAIKENKDKEYKWKYDETKPLKEQNLNRDTISYLSYLNIQYLLNDEQKELMSEIIAFNDKKSKNKNTIKPVIDFNKKQEENEETKVNTQTKN